MTETLEQKLCKDYPKIFRKGFGFECGDGWYWLIDNLCDTIQRECDRTEEQVVAMQVKSKFGSLRYYISDASERVYNYVEFAEGLSYTICEVCGSTKDVEQTSNGWIQTLCDECRSKK